jgi:hypothetical protein
VSLWTAFFEFLFYFREIPKKTWKNRLGHFATYLYDFDAEFCAEFSYQRGFELSTTKRQIFGKKPEIFGKLEKFI